MNDIKGYELVICGDGPYKEQLEKQISKLNVNNIHLLGYVSPERLKYEYGTASIFVFPSSAESFGIVLIEAMASGCAVITSNDTACPDVVGNAALLVRPKSSDDIKDSLTLLINNNELLIKLGLNAKKRVEENFSWNKIVKQYLNLYENLIK